MSYTCNSARSHQGPAMYRVENYSDEASNGTMDIYKFLKRFKLLTYSHGTYLGLNELYVWFLLPTYPNFFNPSLNIKMVFREKIPKMGTFSNFVTIFFVKCYNKI